MTISYAFDERIVVMSLRGRYSTDDLKQTLLAAFADPRCPANAVLMFDQRESESLKERSAADVRDMAHFLGTQAHRFNRRLAMVVSQDIAFGLMRMGEMVAEGVGMTPRVFRDVASAREWLLAEDA